MSGRLIFEFDLSGGLMNLLSVVFEFDHVYVRTCAAIGIGVSRSGYFFLNLSSLIAMKNQRKFLIDFKKVLARRWNDRS